MKTLVINSENALPKTTAKLANLGIELKEKNSPSGWRQIGTYTYEAVVPVDKKEDVEKVVSKLQQWYWK